MIKPLPVEDLEFVSSLSTPFWDTYRGASILLTGGTGFIGRWLLEVFQHANDRHASDIRLVALTRDSKSARRRLPHIFARDDIALLEGDIRTFDHVAGDVDLCVHGAAAYNNPHSTTEPLEVFDTIVDGTRRTLDIAGRKRARRYLLLSSGAVYGPQPGELAGLGEEHNGAPSSVSPQAAYGNAKRASEWLVSAAAARGMPSGSTIARIFSVMGPGMPLDRHFAAGNFLSDALAGRPVKVRDGRPVRSFLYAADLSVWLLRILGNGAGGHVYNVGSEHTLSIAALAQLVARLGGTSAQIGDVDAVDLGWKPPRYVPDTTKARTMLGLEEYTPTELAIRKSLDWSRSCPAS